MKKNTALLALMAALTLTACGSTGTQSDTSTAPEISAEITVPAETTAEEKPETTTATTTASSKTEHETTTTIKEEKPYYEVNSEVFSKLTACKEVSPDSLDPEERQMFEEYIFEHDLKGRYYKNIYQSLYIPEFLFVPSDGLVEDEICQYKQVHIICSVDKALERGYITEKQKESFEASGDSWSTYLLIREWTEGETNNINTEEQPYWCEVTDGEWWIHIRRAFVVAEETDESDRTGHIY